jgi:hypothetical protein
MIHGLNVEKKKGGVQTNNVSLKYKTNIQINQKRMICDTIANLSKTPVDAEQAH